MAKAFSRVRLFLRAIAEGFARLKKYGGGVLLSVLIKTFSVFH